MKKIMIILSAMFVLVGCAKEEKKDITDNPTRDTQTSASVSQTNQTDENDTQTKEIIKMPTLKTVAKELGISVNKINILEQTDNHLLVSFNDSNSGIFEDQARKLEKDGYQLELYDGTISSTFVLKKGNQTISITTISDLDEWKETHQNEMNVKAIKDNDNCVYEIVNQ
ncbi:hypothetical protein [Candidatus Stoquefichus massiliensis]|uniref:hypothetical protein n=1 Tax=Candidatus Stoquefichus massiliensis TaxID=1470350 RepID=UPI00048367F7|nr:hypothetical protein [Candidatus Stoquefichus massiliensis]